jgi:serine/threonine protein kinase
MRSLSDAVLEHLCRVAEGPDLSGTKYEVIKKIGQGGMAAVYLAKDKDLDRPVALKVLLDTPPDPQAKSRMVNEACIIARLEHPGIVPVHDTGVLPDGRIYYAMKLVRGKRLDEYAAPSTTLSETLKIFEKICQAVAFAHTQGVIHRDLKPQNIMVGSFGEVLVMDWGVAKVRGKMETIAVSPQMKSDLARDRASAIPETAHGTILGTPGYMAPEQARGEVERIDERTDVYALGAILHFLLTGQPPLSAARPKVHAGQAPPRLEAPHWHKRALPRALEAICLKALATEQDHRYESVHDLADDIVRFQAQGRVRAYPEGFLRTARRLVVKYRVAIVLILAYLSVRILLLFLPRS